MENQVSSGNALAAEPQQLQPRGRPRRGRDIRQCPWNWKVPIKGSFLGGTLTPPGWAGLSGTRSRARPPPPPPVNLTARGFALRPRREGPLFLALTRLRGPVHLPPQKAPRKRGWAHGVPGRRLPGPPALGPAPPALAGWGAGWVLATSTLPGAHLRVILGRRPRGPRRERGEGRGTIRDPRAPRA